MHSNANERNRIFKSISYTLFSFSIQIEQQTSVEIIINNLFKEIIDSVILIE